MSQNPRTCPVCGAPQQDLSSLDCHACHCAGAFHTQFSGEQAYNLWLATMNRKKEAKAARIYLDSREAGCTLQVTGNTICFHNGKTNKAVICDLDTGEQTVLSHVTQVALNSLYRIFLHPDGTVSSAGDDYYNQRRGLSAISNAVFAAAAPTCAYIVTGDGNVIEQGMNDFSGVPGSWQDIRRIAAHQLHVVGLKQDGTVVYAMAKQSQLYNLANAMKAWQNVKDIVVSDKYALALHQDGTVSYVGVPGAWAEAASWRNIVSVAADSQYAIGLTEDGTVLLAGEESPFVDYGRKEAKQWKNMAFIAAGNSVIAGLSGQGALQTAGNLFIAEGIDRAFSKNVYDLLN